MTRLNSGVLDFYDKKVTEMINEKYGYPPMKALRSFVTSETYDMLSDASLEMWQYAPAGIFDMWESEMVTGDPRNSLYLRGE